jgi:methyl-accepting chemotaxis protein
MGLRLKFNLILSLSTILFLIGSGFVGYKVLQDNARVEILEKARIMMESAVAVRQYTVKEIKPLLAVQQKRQFLPQTVPAYAAHRYVKALQEKYPEYSYKEATLNPTNPADKATEWEADIVSYFRSNDSVKELVGERDTPMGPSLYLGHPIKITNPACLACHDKPSNAPETLLNTYGDSNGFGWKLNEIVGAQLVSVPMSVPLERAQQTFYVFIGALVVGFTLLGLLLNVMLHYVVIKPLRNVSAKADEVSMGGLNVAELQITGKDEVASIGRSFNRMHRSLKNALKMLDDDD